LALRGFNVHVQVSHKASVVGWLANPEPRCFTWTARPGAQLQWVTHAFLGSGAGHFSKAILYADASGHSGNLTPIEFAKFISVTKAIKILTEELSTAETLQNNYGYGLEIAIWNGEAFEFVPSLTFSFYNAVVGPGDRNQIQSVFVRIYKHYERFSALETMYTHDTVGPDGSIGPHAYIELVTPLHDECSDIKFDKLPLDPNAQYYCFAIAFKDYDSKVAGIFNLTVEPSLVDLQGDSKKFRLVLRDTASIFAEIRKIIAARKR
jgi:hypothetical protein